MRIVIIRHGQTEANIMNANGTTYFMGALDNNMTQLTEKGRNDAKKLINDKDNFKKWRRSFTQHAPNGESYDDVSNRCRQFLESLDLQSDEIIGVYSNFHVIRCLFLNLFNIQPKDRIFKLHIEHCIPYVVEGSKLGKMKLVSHNLEEMLKKD